MKIESLATPATPQVNGAKSEITGLSARDRAIAKLLNTGPQTAPVQNPTRVTPEEFTAIQPPKGQNYSNEAPQSSATAEAPADAATTPPAEDKPLSSQYAILARKERQLRERERQLKQREESMKPKAEEPASKPQFDPSKYVSLDDLKKDPFGILTGAGLTYDELTERALNAPKHEQVMMMNEIKALNAKIAALEGETQNNKKSFEDTQKQQYDQAMNQIKRDVHSLVKADPAFETIKETNSIGDVVKLIEKTWNDDGILMSVEEAAQEVETYLVDDAIRRSKIGKIQRQLNPQQPSTPKATGQPEQQSLKTLTNSVASTRPLSARERAILAFENKLTK